MNITSLDMDGHAQQTQTMDGPSFIYICLCLFVCCSGAAIVERVRARTYKNICGPIIEAPLPSTDSNVLWPDAYPMHKTRVSKYMFEYLSTQN